jgi:hypothetical protein
VIPDQGWSNLLRCQLHSHSKLYKTLACLQESAHSFTAITNSAASAGRSCLTLSYLQLDTGIAAAAANEAQRNTAT